MHVKSLKLFCDVVDHRSFSRAADENGISQSGASQMVHQLEDHLGVKLLDRSKRPFVLTPAGDIYYQGCRKLVQKLAALEDEVRSLHKEVAGRVVVAAIYSVGLSHMDRFVHDFQKMYPKANVRIDYQHPDKVYQQVENDRVDIGLVSFPKPSRTVKALAWRDEPMAVVCAADHPWAQRSTMRLCDLDGASMIAFDRDLAIRHDIDRVLVSERVQVDAVMEFDNIENIKRAIEIGAGVGLLPKPTVEREVSAGTLHVIDLSDIELVRPLGIIYRHGKQLGSTAKRFIELLRDSSPTTLASPCSSAPRAAVNDNGRSSNGDAPSPDGEMATNKTSKAAMSVDD